MPTRHAGSWILALAVLGCSQTPPGGRAPGDADEPTPTAATAVAPPAATTSTRTLFATVLGRPLGTLKIERSPLPSGGERWTTTTEMTLALDDPGESASTSKTIDISDYAADLTWVSSDETSTEADAVERTITRRAGDKLQFEHTSPSHSTSKTLDVPDDFVSDRQIYARLRAEVAAGAPLPHGASYSTFDEDSMAFERATLTLVSRASFTIDGKAIPTWNVEVRDHEDERTVAELDEDGVPVRLSVGAFAASVTPNDAAASDVRLSSYLEIEGHVPRRADNLRVVVEIEGEDPADSPIFRDDGYQKVERTAGGYTLDLQAMHGNSGKSLRYPLGDIPADVRGFLEPTGTSQSDHPDIVARARALADGMTDARATAAAITMWVHENLGKRDGTRGAATPAETLAAGFGDCTEHSALTVALLRAAGLPARNVSGVVLVPGFFGADAGYHAWVEVWIGEWIALDPALGTTEVSAHYLHLGYDEPGLPSGSGGLSRMLGRSKIVVQ